MELKLPSSLKLFNDKSPVIVFNKLKHYMDDFPLTPLRKAGRVLYQVTEDVNIAHQILNACYQNNIQSIMVEGGAKLLQSFIDEDLWDEARIITNETLHVERGLAAPELSGYKFSHSQNIFSDKINYYYNKSFLIKQMIE